MRYFGYILIAQFMACNSYAALIKLEYGSANNYASQETTFFITFNEAPDFFTLDGANRQADSFQYYIDTDASDPTPGNNVESVIRGSEIHIDGDIRIRDRYGYDGTDLDSGGWGPILGSVSYSLSGSTLSFTTPWAFMNEDDGIFTYQLLLTEYGGLSNVVYGLSGESYVITTPPPSSVPLPTSLLLMFSGLITLLGFVRKQSMPNKSLNLTGASSAPPC